MNFLYSHYEKLAIECGDLSYYHNLETHELRQLIIKYSMIFIIIGIGNKKLSFKIYNRKLVEAMIGILTLRDNLLEEGVQKFATV